MLLFLAAPAMAVGHDHAAHVHGVAKLEVAVDGAALHVHLESPLEALLGFEHAPRGDKERAEVARMRRALAQGDNLFVPTAAARCKFVSVQVEAPSLEAQPPASGQQAHADLDADFSFTCAQPGQLTGMEVRLADTFPGMRRVDAQVVSAKGQSAAKLTSKMRYLSW
jgi:hypothetical protein